MNHEQAQPSPSGVVMITHRYHPTFSGSAVQAHRLGRQLLGRGWRVSVLTARLRGGAVAREVIDGIPVQRPAAGPPAGV